MVGVAACMSLVIYCLSPPPPPTSHQEQGAHATAAAPAIIDLLCRFMRMMYDVCVSVWYVCMCVYVCLKCDTVPQGPDALLLDLLGVYKSYCPDLITIAVPKMKVRSTVTQVYHMRNFPYIDGYLAFQIEF